VPSSFRMQAAQASGWLSDSGLFHNRPSVTHHRQCISFSLVFNSIAGKLANSQARLGRPMSAAVATLHERTSVFVLAQNRLLREALSRILDKKTDLSVTGACDFSPLSLVQIIEAGPDILVIDAFTAQGASKEFLREIQQNVPQLRIVVIGLDNDEQTFMNLMREGVLGFVLTDASATEVATAVRAVARGEAVCPAQLSKALFLYAARQLNQIPSFQVKTRLGFTSREQQLVELLARGLTNKEIANELRLANQTVRNHVHRMLRKVGASDRLAVVEICRMNGLPV